MNLSRQGVPVDLTLRQAIVNLCANGESIVKVSQRFGISYQTVWNILKIFQQTGSVERKRGGNNNRTSRTDDVIEYVEFLKSVKPSIYPNEIRKKLVENRVCLAENVPSNASVSRIMTDDLGYSYKILRQIPAETDRPDVQEKVVRYLADVCDIDVNNMHFFDESSFVRTTGNRKRGHSAIGQPAYEVQKYASNATYTLNLLHNVHGVSHFNILRGASNGQELLNFFEEALQVDRLGNSVLKDGYVVIMDNCGFHHAFAVEPILHHMLFRRGVRLIFQPPYHPVYNTCEYCFHYIKCWLRRFPLYTEHYTEVAIAEATVRIGSGVSGEFFRQCGYI